MPSKLMTIPDALQYAKKYKLSGIKVEGNTLVYVNSVGKTKRVPIKKGMLIYYRGGGKWAIYSPERDAKIISHKIRVPVKDKKAWQHYGDLNPEMEFSNSKEVYAKIGRGKGKRKKIKRKIPKGGGKNSL